MDLNFSTLQPPRPLLLSNLSLLDSLYIPANRSVVSYDFPAFPNLYSLHNISINHKKAKEQAVARTRTWDLSHLMSRNSPKRES